MVVKHRFRLYLFTLVILLGFGALAQRLWNLSVERHDEFVHKVPGTTTMRARIPGTRGEIRDRNGEVLVTNKSSFEVRVNLRTLVDEYDKQLKVENKLLPKGEKPKKIPTRRVKFLDRGIMREKDETDIVAIFNEVVIEALNKLGLAAPYNAKQLGVHYRTNRGIIPWVYRSDLTYEQFAQFAEHRLGLPGITVEERPVRRYLYDSLACHVLGYVNQPDVDNATEADVKEWGSGYVPDDYGVYGVEKTFDTDLCGRPGIRTWLKNEKGRLVRELTNDDPMTDDKPNFQAARKGYDVFLTLDARIQVIAEKALREGQPAIGRGAVVVLQPATGEVLAMASVPSFNPNKFIPSISQEDFADLNTNECHPLLNRAVRGFVPGSTYKIMTSFAGILGGVQGSHFNCPGGITVAGRFMQCWIGQKGGAHGTVGLSEAIMRSCNCFFFQYGNAAGDANLTKSGDMFGLGQRTGIELEEEDPGILPTKRWWNANRSGFPYTSATIANISIGQGAVLATPLQMAGVAAAVGNGGIALKPHLLKKVTDGPEVVREPPPDVRANFADLGLTPEKLELVRKGMWRVVMDDNGGTARAARIPGVEVAGKTGTAQNWRKEGGEFVKDNHTLFITFAPYDNPKFACCILVQGGKGGGVSAAPIAKRIMEQALALDSGYQVPLVAIEEVKGNFKPVEVVTFDGVTPIALPGTEEEDTGTAGDEPPKPKSVDTQPKVKARIRDNADAEGSEAVKNKQAPRRGNFFQRVFGR